VKSTASSGARLVLTREDGTPVGELALPSVSGSPGVTVTVTSPSLQGTRTTSPTQTVFMCCARFHRDATT